MSAIPASSARDEALEMPSRWVHALDNSQWEALRALMTDDFAYRYADGAHPERTWFSGAEESIRRLQAIADGVVAVQHYLANSLLDLSEDYATVAVYDLPSSRRAELPKANRSGRWAACGRLACGGSATAGSSNHYSPNKPSKAPGWKTCRVIPLGGRGKQKILTQHAERKS
jgi:hypothetical protein